MLAYYEAQTEHAPAHLLGKLSETLAVTVDELLGVEKPRRSRGPPVNLRLWRRLRVVEQLPPEDRKAVLNFVEALAAKRKLQQG